MEKKYDLSEENNETGRMSEPAIAYGRNIYSESLLPSYSVEEMRERADRAIIEVEEGKVFSQEEMRKRHPR